MPRRLSCMGRAVRAAVVVVSLVWLLPGAEVASAVNIETVPVGNPGNAPDTEVMWTDGTTGYGAVSYEYNIGKYKVTAGQYTEFLNAVADTDTYGLYNSGMADTSFGSGITRAGSPGSYSYSVDAAHVNRPVNFVSFWDACRFANWLHNGQLTGAQDATTTEDGAYTLTPDGIANNTITRNTGAIWAVTSEDEWYKAAYHKNDGVTGNYFEYPTSSDTAPGQDMADVSGNNANYYTVPNVVPIDSPYYTTVVGEFQNSDSPYGTFDQGGNVWEWNDAIVIGWCRGLRGGWFSANADYLRAAYRFRGSPSAEDRIFGFRVSRVPEPASVTVMVLGVVGMLMKRPFDTTHRKRNVA